MHDIRAIRENPAAFDAAMAKRGISGASSEILAIDEARRAAIHQAETLKAEANAAAKHIGAAKAAGDNETFERLRAEVAAKKAKQAEIVQSWGGMIDVTPDAVPVISEVDDLPGMFIATGFSGHGFGIGPGAGRLMADLVTGVEPCVNPAAFRLSRFTDGSKVRPDPGF